MFQSFLRAMYKLANGGYNILLILLLLLLAFRPINRDFFYIALWELILAAVFFTATFHCSHHRLVRALAMIVGIPALLLDWITLSFGSSQLTIISIALMIGFMLICTISVFHREILVSHASWKNLTPVICAYFLIGFAFAYGFVLVEFLYPGALQIVNTDPHFYGHGEYLSQAVAMSFSSLLALNGLSESMPGAMQTMMLVEGLLSQFYLAALTSQIISIYRASRIAKQTQVEHKNKNFS